MKVALMDPGIDFSLEIGDPQNADDVTRDLELDLLWDAMADGDAFVRKVVRIATLHPVVDAARIRYRQEALIDTAKHPETIRELYAITLDALSVERGILMMPMRGHPEMAVSRGVRMLTGLAVRLEHLRDRCAQAAPEFTSAAFRGLFATVADQLDASYLRELRGQLSELSFSRGLLMSAAVGPGGRVSGQVLRRAKQENRGFFDHTPLRRPLFSFTIPERDEAGFTALGELRARSLVDVANAATESVDNVTGFFRALRAELAFYLGALNLQIALERLRVPLCVPVARQAGETRAVGLCDPCLALHAGAAPVGNAVELEDSRLLLVTGANHGGKSTLLRALGVAQLMMQAGLFVTSTAFTGPIVGAIHTHWTREEDEDLRHGKLDEELERMSEIVTRVEPGDLLLCNESFASTNEAEGSQIAFDVTCALVTAGVRVRFVTHQYDFARSIADSGLGAQFLRAPREPDGARSYLLESGPPLPTSFGVDLYDRAFGTHLARPAGAGSASEQDTSRTEGDPS